MSSHEARGRTDPAKVEALLRRIEAVSQSNDRQIDQFVRSNEPAAAGSGSRPNGWLLLLGGIPTLLLIYQSWLLNQQNQQLAKQMELMGEQTSQLTEQNKQLLAQNTMLQGQSSFMKAQQDRLTAHRTLIDDQATFMREQEQQMSAQNTLIQRQTSITKAQNQQLVTQNTLIHRQLKQFQALSRRLGVDAMRDAIDTLRRVQPCAGQTTNGSSGSAQCPGASTHARQDALDTYLAMSRASGTAAELSNARLDGLRLDQANLRDADFRRAVLSESTFEQADVRGANFTSSSGLARPQQWCFDSRTAFPQGFEPGTSDRTACRSQLEVAKPSSQN